MNDLYAELEKSSTYFTYMVRPVRAIGLFYFLCKPTVYDVFQIQRTIAFAHFDRFGLFFA
jgi:hypothetical protein